MYKLFFYIIIPDNPDKEYCYSSNNFKAANYTFYLYKHKISILGLAFKEGTNDVRHSLSIRLAKFLIEQGAIVSGHDILAAKEAAQMEDKLIVSDNLNDVLNQAEIVIILNSEKIYSQIDWSIISPKTYIIDTRGIVNIDELKKYSIEYDLLGTK